MIISGAGQVNGGQKMITTMDAEPKATKEIEELFSKDGGRAGEPLCALRSAHCVKSIMAEDIFSPHLL